MPELKELLLFKLEKHGYRLVVKDGKLEITFLALLNIQCHLTIRDFGAGLIKEADSFCLDGFKGNHKNLKKELEHFSQQLQSRAAEFSAKEGEVEPLLFSADYCQLYFQKEAENVHVFTSSIWDRDDE